MEIALKLFAVVFLVLANGFFVAAEFSLVAVRRSRVEQMLAEGNRFAPAVMHGVKHLDMYLAACQLGITLASLALGWIGEPALATLIEPVFQALPSEWALVSSHTIAITIAFTIITILHIVIGELAPKSMALQRTESTALAVALPLRIFLIVFRPAIFILNSTGNLLIRAAGMRPASTEEQVHSVEELRYLVVASREAGVLDEVESEMVGRAFQFGETRAHQVMAPRTEIIAVSADASVEDALEYVIKGGHSRLPVYEANVDYIVGILHLRDLVTATRSGHDVQAEVRTIMREPLVLPETVSIETVLAELRRKRTQMAILIDEHGGTAGLVTLKDLVEQIVGDVSDEFEQPRDTIVIEPDGTALIDGRVSVEDLEDEFNLDIPDDEQYDTVGGLVMAHLGRIAQVGDEISLPGYSIKVESMDGLRVASVRLFKKLNGSN